jgi:hypothetical protein
MKILHYTKAHPELTFLVTPIGCGIAGWRESEIAPLFREASKLPNVTLPEGKAAIQGDMRHLRDEDDVQRLQRLRGVREEQDTD